MGVAGIKPVGCGGLTGGKEPVLGGVCILGGVGSGFATGADTSGSFLSFLPNHNAICRGVFEWIAWKACQTRLMVHYYLSLATVNIDVSNRNIDTK
jgi:hypothetical protein